MKKEESKCSLMNREDRLRIVCRRNFLVVMTALNLTGGLM